MLLLIVASLPAASSSRIDATAINSRFPAAANSRIGATAINSKLTSCCY